MTNENKEEMKEKTNKIKSNIRGEESVAKRLIRSYLIVGGTSAVIILIAIGFLINISADVKLFRDTSYMATSSAWNARRSIVVVQNNLLKATTTFNEQETKAYLDLSVRASEDLRAAVKLLEDTEIVTKEQTIQIDAIIKIMSEKRGAMIEQASLNNEVGNAAAIKILMEEYSPNSDQMGVILEDIAVSADSNANQYVTQSTVKAVLCIVLIIVLFIINIILTVASAKALTKKITVPLIEIENAVRELAEGNLDVKLEFRSKDEFGKLAHNLRNTINELRKYITNITGVLDEIAKKNMQTGIEIEYKGKFMPLKESMNYIIDFLNEMITKIKEAASQVSQGSNQMAEASQSLATGASDQSSSVEELLATINNVAEAVDINAGNAKNVNKLSDDSMHEIEKGNEYMSQLLYSMQQIAEQSNQVSNIVKVIDEISAQTNLLSLNASIEAARAGEHGKGFAVVANEIGKLANESAEAARNSTELIGKTIGVVNTGSKLTDETAGIFRNIVNSSEQTGKLVGDIATACQQQAVALNEILKGVQQIADVTESNSATAEETSASSEELSSEAEMLFRMLEEYKVK